MTESYSPVLLNTATARDPALEAAFRAINAAVAADADARLLAATVRGVMIGYHARWGESGWRAVAMRPVFRLPIINPASGRRSRTFEQAGRCDGVIVRRRQEFLLEWKLAAEEIDRPDAPFWRRLAVDTQADTYIQARRQQRRPVAGVLYDVLRRPQVKPRLVPKGAPGRTEHQNEGSRLELQRNKTYFGWPVEEEACDEYFQGDGRETPALYALRIAADTLRRPGWYFQRRIAGRGEAQLARHRQELWQTAVEIRLARRAGRHYGNSEACMAYHRPCPYLPICSGRDAPDSERWQPIGPIHPELEGELGEADPARVLTHSRIQCFKLCRRRHDFRYQLGIVPREPLESEVLRFGRVIRQALAAWWGCRAAGRACQAGAGTQRGSGGNGQSI